MQLQSFWFSGKERLRRCLVSHREHVKEGDSGLHVQLIQDALMMLEGASIDRAELAGKQYGKSTTLAALAYKRKRNIVNQTYQASPDGIVGQMTLKALDEEMSGKERTQLNLRASGIPFLRGFFFSPVLGARPKCIVVTETGAPWFAWAKHFASTFRPSGMGDMVTIGNNLPVSQLVSRLQMAAAMAGPGGFLVLSVGHGGHGEASWSNEGFFDLAPGGAFRVGGQSSRLPGDPPSPSAPSAKPVAVSAFYDYRIPNATQAGGFIRSRKDEDEASGTAAAKSRLANWQQYEQIASSFRSLSGVILMTCKVGGGSDFLKRVRQQWGVPIVAYTRRVFGLEQANGRTRIYLDGDAPETGTNTAWGEYLFPLSRDMVVFN